MIKRITTISSLVTVLLLTSAQEGYSDPPPETLASQAIPFDANYNPYSAIVGKTAEGKWGMVGVKELEDGRFALEGVGGGGGIGDAVIIKRGTITLIERGTVAISMGTVTVERGTVAISMGTITVIERGTVAISRGTVTIESGTVSVGGTVTVNIDRISNTPLEVPVLPGHPYAGCKSYSVKTTSALTNYKLLEIESPYTLYILGVAVFNYSTIAGAVEFSLGGALKYPTTVGGGVGSGYIADVYWTSNPGDDLSITTVPPTLGITIYFTVR